MDWLSRNKLQYWAYKTVISPDKANFTTRVFNDRVYFNLIKGISISKDIFVRKGVINHKHEYVSQRLEDLEHQFEATDLMSIKIYIRASDSEEQVTISFNTLEHVLASLGGLANLLHTVFRVALVYFIRKSYLGHLISRLYSF